jgi:hypothetical protein
MKNRPVHENLDTSFVNLSALVKYLRRRRFTGQVRIELSGYEADIYLTAENGLKVREYDHIAGRIAEGEEALQRILIRAREPGGIVNVYQTIAENELVERKECETVPEKKETLPAPFADRSTPQVETNIPDGGGGKSERSDREEKPFAPKTIFPKMPFEFTNKVEARAKQSSLSKADREMLLNLTSELLGTVERSLAMANLEFPSAFYKACAEISADYPFLKTLVYGNGKIDSADAQVNPKFFVAGILEALRRILDKLAQNAKFAEVHRDAVQRILALFHQRRALYDRFSMSKPLERILGA